ncbi:hypothetical protein ceV_122 [Chrysochromulina ericina virus CeV-01B]|uniref:Uncharacterized protein n=1 Tax=Chrysochromulina ericina virus CeV-01B TaxID=3070830 RepID=A0A0N9QA83_9VIRU|nr:hypothetical protein ceV_122 [Chrysochromulina ericina virus]ALH23028.1 hypothetical protein ceV_122 [Chrysochromulina ericina virus CeV-01B]
MSVNENISWHQKIFLYILYISWVLYPISLILETQYNLNNITQFVDTAIKLYVALVLIYKFNPWFGKQEFTKFDRRLAWEAGFFLLISTLSVNTIDFIKKLYTPIKDRILK